MHVTSEALRRASLSLGTQEPPSPVHTEKCPASIVRVHPQRARLYFMRFAAEICGRLCSPCPAGFPVPRRPHCVSRWQERHCPFVAVMRKEGLHA